MTNALTSFFLAAGVAAFAYSKLGRHIGYGNQQSVWIMVIGAFIVAFGVCYVTMSLVLNMH